jgi:hypothetical protein
LDLDDLLDGIGLGIGGGKRAQAVVRILFGLLGTVLGVVGAGHMMGYEASLHFRAVAAALFVFMAAFFFLNVMLLRRVSWLWKGFVAAFVMLFVVRIVLGP